MDFLRLFYLVYFFATSTLTSVRHTEYSFFLFQCTSLVIPDWDSFNSLSDITSPALSIIQPNDSTNRSLESCCFNFTWMTTVKPIFMGQRILLHHISKFIQSSEAEYYLLFDTECQGGCMEINLQFYASETSAPLPSGKFIILVS